MIVSDSDSLDGRASNRLHPKAGSITQLPLDAPMARKQNGRLPRA
jgi:hypothetical protein